MKNQDNLKIGDAVKVKNDIECPDMKNICIGGWQGRISEIIKHPDGGITIGIKWDSKTLKKMPEKFIESSEKDGLDYASMYLYPDDIIKVQPRDSIEDVSNVLKKISKSL